MVTKPDVSDESAARPSGAGRPAAGTGNDRVLRRSLSQQIVDRLRDDIVHGVLPAGTRLIQDELCERFGTSRMPVRDALQQLTHEGLLRENVGQREVVELGADDLSEVHALISVLHGWAAGRVAALATEEELDQLQKLCDWAVAAETAHEFSTRAWEFHRRINVLARSPRLVRTIVGFQATVPKAFPISVPEEVDSTKRRYVAMMAAMRAHNVEAAESLTRSFSEDLRGWLLQMLQRQG